MVIGIPRWLDDIAYINVIIFYPCINKTCVLQFKMVMVGHLSKNYMYMIFMIPNKGVCYSLVKSKNKVTIENNCRLKQDFISFRGYFIRATAIDFLLKKFLSSDSKKKQVNRNKKA